MSIVDALREIKDRLATLERKVSSMVRVGIVDTVDRAKCRVTVTFDVPGGQCKSWNLPVMVKWAATSSDYDMPAVGEQVTCIFLPSGPEVGFVLGSFYSDEDPIPEGADADGMRVVEFSDGARFEYSTEESKLRILIGALELTFTPDLIQIGGSGATQPFVLGTSITDWLAAHVHPTGVGPSGPPTTAGTLSTTLSTIIKGR